MVIVCVVLALVGCVLGLYLQTKMMVQMAVVILAVSVLTNLLGHIPIVTAFWDAVVALAAFECSYFLGTVLSSRKR